MRHAPTMCMKEPKGVGQNRVLDPQELKLQATVNDGNQIQVLYRNIRFS